MKNLTKKVAAVTGAGSGMGRELAIALAKEGCDVAISDINADNLQATADLLKPYNVKVTTAKLDVSDEKAVFAWADEVVAQHGKVNLVFNNAGVALGSKVEDLKISDFEWIMGINFWGVVYGTKAFLPHLKQAGEGHIVNVSSLFGLLAQPMQSAYNASKFAVRGFTESLRQELDMRPCGVSCTCVHPGGIRTNIANNARMSDTGKAGDNEKAKANFNKLLHFPADKAAQLMIQAVKDDTPRLLIGADAHAMDLIERLTPSHYAKVVAKMTKLAAKFGK